MKGKIDKGGFLYIERAGKYIKQFCPFSAGSYDCCHWCALFGEPWGDRQEGEEIKLELCKKTLHFSEFIDERKVK